MSGQPVEDDVEYIYLASDFSKLLKMPWGLREFPDIRDKNLHHYYTGNHPYLLDGKGRLHQHPEVCDEFRESMDKQIAEWEKDSSSLREGFGVPWFVKMAEMLAMYASAFQSSRIDRFLRITELVTVPITVFRVTLVTLTTNDMETIRKLLTSLSKTWKDGSKSDDKCFLRQIQREFVKVEKTRGRPDVKQEPPPKEGAVILEFLPHWFDQFPRS